MIEIFYCKDKLSLLAFTCVLFLCVFWFHHRTIEMLEIYGISFLNIYNLEHMILNSLLWSLNHRYESSVHLSTWHNCNRASVFGILLDNYCYPCWTRLAYYHTLSSKQSLMPNLISVSFDLNSKGLVTSFCFLLTRSC